MDQRFKWNVLWAIPILLTLSVVLAPKSSALSGTGTETDPYVISAPEDLAAMHQDLDGHYVLGRSIDLRGYALEPVGNEWEGPFTGSLDGRGYTLSNLTMELSTTKYVGLFGYLEGSVSNLKLSDVDIVGGYYVGTVAGLAADTSEISGCQVLSGAVTLKPFRQAAYAGGIVGQSEGALSSSENCATVSGHGGNHVYIGGIAGRIVATSDLQIEGLSNSGNVSGDVYGKGGIVGFIDANGTNVTILSCKNSGEIHTPASNAGGLVGRLSSTKFDFNQCINTGDVNGRYINNSSLDSSTGSGGLVGFAEGSGTMQKSKNYGAVISGRSGGLIGISWGSLSFSFCENYGCIGDINKSNYVGGFVGGEESSNVDITLSYCQNHGNVTGRIYSGGVLGYKSNYTYPDLKYCINRGNVYTSSEWYYADSWVGGNGGVGHLTKCVNLGTILGKNSKFFSLWIRPNEVSIGDTVKARSASIYIEGFRCSDLRGGTSGDLSFADMKKMESYPGLDFEEDWSIDPNRNSGLPTPNGLDVDYMDQSVLILRVGEESTVTPPFQADSWEVSNEAILSCEDSLITAKGVGSGVVKAKSRDGRQANCVVFVYQVRNVTIKESVELKPQGSTTLTTNVPDYDPQGIHWSSSDTTIASVNQNGVVTAQNQAGTAIITAYLPLSKTSASCEVTVVGDPITGVYMNTDPIITAGIPTKLPYSVSPTAYKGTLTWESSDESVLTVENGVATGQKSGTAVVTVTSDTGCSASCLVTVKQPCQRLTLDRTETTLELGYTDQLIAAMAPEDSTDTITWSSSNTSVVTVSSTGILTPRKIGQAVIVAKASSGVTGQCTVTVKQAAILPTSVTLDRNLIRPAVGEKVALCASILPDTATDKALVWTSSNPAVASVSSTGVVEALTPGTTEIRATTANGLYDICQVHVAQVSSAAFTLKGSRIQTEGQAGTEVYISKNPGVAAFSINVTYDAAKLTPVAVTPGDILSVGTLTSNVETAASDGYLRVTWYSAEDMAQDGLAFVIDWEAGSTVASVPISLDFGPEDICNREKINVGFSVQPCQMEIIDYMIGDIYQDSLVNMKDIVYFARWFNGQETLNEAQRLSADVYFDENLDVKDLTELAQLLNQGLTGRKNAAQTMSLRIMAAETPYEVSVSSAEVDDNGDVLLTVTGQNCPGLAAFRFQLNIPEGYEVKEVLPGSALPQSTGFLYTPQSKIVSWYQDSSAELNGVLFTICLHTKANMPQAGVLTLDYLSEDFFNPDSYETIPIVISYGEVLVKESVAFEISEIHEGMICFDIVSNAEVNGLLIATYYEESGKLLDVKNTEITTVTGKKNFSIEPPRNWSTCKLFLIDSSRYIPLCKNVEIKKG